MAFTDVYTPRFGWFPKNEILRTAGCLGMKEDSIKCARQGLGIEETEINGVIHWRWSATDDPEYIWGEED